MKRILFIALGMILLCNACKKSEERQLEKDIEIIKDYLDDNNLVAQSTASGLHYIIDVAGEGENPNSLSDVTVIYEGYHPSGSVFDQSTDDGASFSLTSVIEGWQEGIPLFKVGGSGVILLPSSLAYGPTGNSNIGGDAVLIFDIELVSID
ncbi:MAG TPA: peptidylprolyl isomerase [Flavobacteriales bacterium]|nr:peptidylprolyl isomerase [Flavobacteriales bacterium]|tara:strand:+ start:2368 stop:2820 length:453 start_codon:yes stop_codon:yes gene_type:complete